MLTVHLLSPSNHLSLVGPITALTFLFWAPPAFSKSLYVAEADLSPRAVHEMVALVKMRRYYVCKPDFKHDADGSEPHTSSAGHKTAGQVEDPEPDWPLMHRWLQKAAEQPKCAIFSFGLRLGGSAVACTPNSH